jgi:UDP-N-acetylmuramate--alanine ligase
VLCVINLLGLPIKDAAFPLSTFKGVGRRFQVCGEANEITIIDDYAHHPTEIRATLAAARDRYNQRHIWAVWQPHTYSRTQSLFNEFTRSFNDADHVIVTEIYAAREEKQDYSSVQIVKSMNHPNVRFIPTLNDVVDYLVAHLQPGDVLLVLSAGDADQVSTQVLTRLQESEAKDD